MSPDKIKELLPPAVAVLFLVASVGLVFEILIASVEQRPVDPVATSALGTVIGATIPALVLMYFRASTPIEKPDDDDYAPPRRHLEVERTGDPESDAWNEDHGWLHMGSARCLRLST